MFDVASSQGVFRSPHTFGIWTGNKARLVEHYLLLFRNVTRHGTYIDGFAGPQRPDDPDTWTARLVIDSQPRSEEKLRFRNFHLCDIEPRKVRLLYELKEDRRDLSIEVYDYDFNAAVEDILQPSVLHDEATFCLLDQTTFECHWSTLAKLAAYRSGKFKIELFYFLPVGWLNRGTAAASVEILERWWGKPDWEDWCKRGVSPWIWAERWSARLQDELGYAYTTPYPIYDRQPGSGSDRIMYFMVHATDHPAAPSLMERSYKRAVRSLPVGKQQRLFT